MELGVSIAADSIVNFLPLIPSSLILSKCSATSVMLLRYATIMLSASFSVNIRMSLSIRASPFILTNGLGTLIPSLFNLEPSPAAIIAYFIVDLFYRQAKVGIITDKMKLFILILVFYMVFYDKLNNKGKNMNNINCLFVMLFCQFTTISYLR